MVMHRIEEILEQPTLSSTLSLLKTPEGIALGVGKTVGNSIEGWAPGAIFIHSDGDNKIESIYINTGSVTSATWTSLYTDYTKQALASNYVTATGSNNALAVALTDAAGDAISLAAGLKLLVNTSTYTLQSGANTLALNGGSAKSIKSHLNVSNDISGGYAAGSIVNLIYDGTQWQDLAK